MPNRRRGKKRPCKEGTLRTNKRRTGLSSLQRVDETMCQGLSTFNGVDETVVHGLSPCNRFDETGAVTISSSSTSDLQLIVGCAENKIVKNKCGDGLSPLHRVDETVHGLSPCDRRLDETSVVARSSSSASELKVIFGCGKFVLYLVVGCCVLFYLLCAISYVVRGSPAIVCFEFEARMATMIAVCLQETIVLLKITNNVMHALDDGVGDRKCIEIISPLVAW